MNAIRFPVIDLQQTGANITRLRQERGLSVRDLQRYFGFDEPVAIYKWQKGQSLPSVDNLFALSALLGVPMNEILVESNICIVDFSSEQQGEPCCSVPFWGKIRALWYGRIVGLLSACQRSLPIVCLSYRSFSLLSLNPWLSDSDGNPAHLLFPMPSRNSNRKAEGSTTVLPSVTLMHRDGSSEP